MNSPFKRRRIQKEETQEEEPTQNRENIRKARRELSPLPTFPIIPLESSNLSNLSNLSNSSNSNSSSSDSENVQPVLKNVILSEGDEEKILEEREKEEDRKIMERWQKSVTERYRRQQERELKERQEKIRQEEERKLKEKQEKDRKENDVLTQYKFMHNTEPSESVSSFIDYDEIPEYNVLSLEYREKEELYQALLLLQKGDIAGFLNSPIIERKFRPVYTVIESCGFGGGLTQVLWKQAWYPERVKIVQGEYEEGKCVSCDLHRGGKYEVYINGNRVGFMGSSCYKIRFTRLLNLIKICKEIANLIHQYNITSNNSLFEEVIEELFQRAIWKVTSVPSKMAERYKKK